MKLGAVFGQLRTNKPISNYVSVPANNNLKSRLRVEFYGTFAVIFPHEASTSSYGSRELKRNSKVVCWTAFSKV